MFLFINGGVTHKDTPFEKISQVTPKIRTEGLPYDAVERRGVVVMRDDIVIYCRCIFNTLSRMKGDVMTSM